MPGKLGIAISLAGPPSSGRSPTQMDPHLLQTHCQRLGVSPEVSAHDLERAWMRASFAATQARDDAAKAAARASFEVLKQHVAEREQGAALSRRSAAAGIRAARREMGEDDSSAPPASPWDLTRRDNPWVNALALPVVGLLALAINHSPLAFFLQAFKIWIHEFGHATVSWLAGYKALPLPIGWTTYSETREPFVYWGVLFLLGVFFVAGWRERRIWPVLLAPPLAALQWWMTWRVEDWQVEQWQAWSGVGGEFYLNALMIAAFYLDLPEKFRWGGLRWLFLFWGAVGFLDTYGFWRDIARGVEDVPWGSMLHGEGDEGGDMNQLHDGWGWSRQRIVASYTLLGERCLWGIGGVWLFFNLRLNRVLPWLLDRRRGRESNETG